MDDVDTLMCDMFVGGVSQQVVGTVVEHLTRSSASLSTVSQVFHSLEEEFAVLQIRSLPARYWYVFADGTYFSVISNGVGHTMPILALIGVTPDGTRLRRARVKTKGRWENLLADQSTRRTDD